MPQERPVGTYPSDEEIMVHALKEAEGKGLSYKQALEGLHGVPSFLVVSDVDTRVVDRVPDKRTPCPPMEGLLPRACSQNKSFVSRETTRVGEETLPRQDVLPSTRPACLFLATG